MSLPLPHDRFVKPSKVESHFSVEYKYLITEVTSYYMILVFNMLLLRKGIDLRISATKGGIQSMSPRFLFCHRAQVATLAAMSLIRNIRLSYCPHVHDNEFNKLMWLPYNGFISRGANFPEW